MRNRSLISAILLFAVTLGTFSCGGHGDVSDSSSDGQTDSSAPEETKLSDTLEKKNYSGTVFNIYMPSQHDYEFSEEQTGERVDDAEYSRDRKVEELLGVKLNYITEPGDWAGKDTFNGRIKQSVMAGDGEYDLVDGMIAVTNMIVPDGVFLNLMEQDGLDFDDPWWAKDMDENLSVTGKLYGICGAGLLSMYKSSYIIYYNQKLIDDFGLENPIDLVLDGKWTFDALNQVVADKDDDLNNDDVYNENDDFFGFAVQMHGLMTQSLLCGAGVNLSSVTDDGSNIVIDFSGDRTANVVEKIRQLIPQHIVYGGSGVNVSKIFTENRSIAMMHFVESSMNSLRDMKSDYYILPVPKYDEAQDGYRSFVNAWINAFSAIPANADLEFSGFITEALARYSYEVIRPRAYDITYKAKATRDDESAEMLDIVFDNVYLDFNAIYDFSGMMNAFNSVLVDQTPLASTLASKLTSAQTQAEKLVQNWVD